MFAEIGRGDTYEEDYRYLSAIGHGSTEEAILHYSHPTVSVRSDRHTPILLTFATPYYLALAHVWENWFHVVDQEQYLRTVQPLLERVAQKDGSSLPANEH
ncbi:MAG: hypothetical protein H0T90_04640 [Gemmatimonadales bacterium]|jgi:hypothetical protein|nr:hypothetical protein [Gemmatimonadales bacterium]